jgi:hypothetical protein
VFFVYDSSKGVVIQFLHSFGGSGGSGVLIGGLISGNGVWRKFWLGRLMIFGSSMNAR